MKNTRTVLLSACCTTLLLGACVDQDSTRLSDAAKLAASADDLLVVDCLLPGQVRRLGTQMTYLTARRPIQTTQQDCAIRGGEYVAYDRASYASAARIWMPLAEQGDADAQNKIGEIYERGLGVPPDYVQAARWYRRAAEQGLEKAQINLGFLYEKGLGVQQDLTTAVEWYRRASKLPDAVMIDRVAYEAQLAQIDSLKKQLDRSHMELEKARRDLRDRARKLQRDREALQKQLQSSASVPVDAAQRKRLQEAQRRLERQGQELAQREQRIRELESASRRQKERALLLEIEGGTLREQLALVRTELQRSQQDMQHYQSLSAENARQLESVRSDLAALDPASSDASRQTQALRSELATRERELADKRRQVAELEEQASELAARLDRTSQNDRQAIARVNQALTETNAALANAKAVSEEYAKQLDQLQTRLATKDSELAVKDQRLVQLTTMLEEREASLGRQEETLQQLRKEADQWKEKLAQLEARQTQTSTTSRTADADVPLAPPSIQLIEPPLVTVRSGDDTQVPIKRGTAQRSLVGQVTAPAGLFALTLNGERMAPDSKGLFKADVRITGQETPVNLVAVDKQGRRSNLALRLVTEAEAATVTAQRVNPLAGIEIGGYHALVIGNRDYAHLPDLDTSANDAKAVAAVLEEKFGYKVTLLIDATRYEILSELNRLRQSLTDKDNLLVYYAGHGELDRVNLRGHWLPVDAEAESTANWVSNVAITDILNAMSVRQVLMVADSCYSGALTRSSLSQLDAGQSEETRQHWIKTLARMRSRTALTSGGLSPVLDGGGGAHSVFAKAFLGVLRDMDDITEGQRLYRDVSARVAYEANRFQVEQVPEYAPIKFSGHEAGDFLFIPKAFQQRG